MAFTGVAVVKIISDLCWISNSSNLFAWLLGIVPSAPILIVPIVTFLFLKFFSYPKRFWYFFSFSIPFVCFSVKCRDNNIHCSTDLLFFGHAEHIKVFENFKCYINVFWFWMLLNRSWNLHIPLTCIINRLGICQQITFPNVLRLFLCFSENFPNDRMIQVFLRRKMKYYRELLSLWPPM